MSEARTTGVSWLRGQGLGRGATQRKKVPGWPVRLLQGTRRVGIACPDAGPGDWETIGFSGFKLKRPIPTIHFYSEHF